MKKRLIISVTSDLVTDQRVHKVSQTLYGYGFEVLLIGRVLPDSLPMNNRDYQVHRMKLWFRRSALFYMNYNIRLFFTLLNKKADLLLANDLDTLPANYLVSVIKRIPLVYDSHEYFTGVPELQHRPLVKGIWEAIECFIFPKLRKIYTVNDSIAGLYNKKYRREISVVRNVPYLQPRNTEPATFPLGKKIIIYQGSGINVNRGAEELILSMKYLPAEGYILWIVGGGDVYEKLKKLAAENDLQNKVLFIGKVPFNELRTLTLQAHLGLSIDKPTNINYLYSLPNKIFDYLHAGVPVLCSALPEIKAVVDRYKVGHFIDHHEPGHIADMIRFMFADPDRYLTWKNNTFVAGKELCWQHESKVVTNIFHEYV